MRLAVAAVGRLKDGPERLLLGRYRERFDQVGRQLGFARLEILEAEESRARRPEDRRGEEAAALARLVGERATICLDERGRALTSAAFAEEIRRMRDAGQGGLAFVIGGADGLDPAFLEGARSTLAFGSLTLPHQLVRVLVVEQLYRAATILAGHPYHRA